MNRFAAEREYFREHPGVALDESAFARGERVEFAVERWNIIQPELKELVAAHYAEIEPAQPDIALEPNWDEYARLDREGQLHVVTARDEGWLVGYDTGIIYKHLHHKNSLHCYSDITYLRPEYRKGLVGYRMMKFFRDSVRDRGVAKLTVGTSLHVDLDRVFERLGYKLDSRVYSVVFR